MPDDIKAEVSVIKEEISAAKSEASSALTMLANLMGTIPTDGVEDEPLAIDEKITEAVNTAFANMGLGALVAGEGAASNAITASLLGPLGAILPFLGNGEGLEGDGVQGISTAALLGRLLGIGGLSGDGEEPGGLGGLFSLLFGGMLAGGEGEEGENPFQTFITEAITNMFLAGEGENGANPLQPLMDAMIANMLTVEEGEESPLQPLFSALTAHVYGSPETEGAGGLIGKLNEHVYGGGGGGMGVGLKDMLTLHGTFIKSEITNLGDRIKGEIQNLWNQLFPPTRHINPGQGDDPRV